MATWSEKYHESHNVPRNPQNREWKRRIRQAARDLGIFDEVSPNGTPSKAHSTTEQWLAITTKAQSGISVKSRLTTTVVWDLLRTPRSGKPTGPGTRERGLIKDPETAMLAREVAVTAILEEKWPAPQFTVEKTGVGSDRAVKQNGQVIALVDVKSSLTITARQFKEAIKSYKQGIPYWLVNPKWKYQVTPETRRVPTQYRIIPEAK